MYAIDVFNYKDNKVTLEILKNNTIPLRVFVNTYKGKYDEHLLQILVCNDYYVDFTRYAFNIKTLCDCV